MSRFLSCSLKYRVDQWINVGFNITYRYVVSIRRFRSTANSFLWQRESLKDCTLSLKCDVLETLCCYIHLQFIISKPVSVSAGRSCATHSFSSSLENMIVSRWDRVTKDSCFSSLSCTWQMTPLLIEQAQCAVWVLQGQFRGMFHIDLPSTVNITFSAKALKWAKAAFKPSKLSFKFNSETKYNMLLPGDCLKEKCSKPWEPLGKLFLFSTSNWSLG